VSEDDTGFHLFQPDPGADSAELRRRLEALEALIARAPVPIAVAHDRDCRFITANAALARLLGVPEGINISMTPGPDEIAPYRIQRDGREMPADELPMQYAIAHRVHVRNHIEIVRADGDVRYVQNDVEPLFDAQGEVCGCVSVVFDLTEHRRAQQVLRDADRAKDEFLATLSHELRNPLAPLRNALEVLRVAGGDEARSAAAHAIMERQLRQLVRLTDDLLDVSRITRNILELRRERIDLRAAVQSAVEATQPLADAAGHRVDVSLPVEPVWVDADFTRLAQAFGNVLNNAVKYTDRGGRIEVRLDAQAGTAMLWVTDSGIGIKPSELPRIFDMFFQLDRALDRVRGGLGIGLGLAKRLIELHGGRLEASSRGVGFGSTFTTRLPLADARGTPAAEPAARTRPAAVSCRVLVAEDIPDAAEMMRMMLDVLGHEVKVASDGRQAVSMAREFNPQVILLDIGMPRMDGYEAARRIRAELGPSVLLVALTGWGQEEDQRRAMEAGFDLHLTKPAEPAVLEALIANRAARE
jgi:signal transduction histidine kinase/CheY-like chemotaxis protein